MPDFYWPLGARMLGYGALLAFGIVGLEPSFRSLGIGECLDVIGMANAVSRVDVKSKRSLVPLKFAASPMMILARRIKLRNVMAVQCPQDADPGEHRRAAKLCNK